MGVGVVCVFKNMHFKTSIFFFFFFFFSFVHFLIKMNTHLEQLGFGYSVREAPVVLNCHKKTRRRKLYRIQYTCIYIDSMGCKQSIH